MHLIRDAGKPLVGHNCLFDIVYILTQFVQSYETWPEFQKGIQEYFPAGVYDTKHICKALESTCEDLFPSNHLGGLYEHLRDSDEGYKHMHILRDAAAHTGTRCASHRMPAWHPLHLQPNLSSCPRCLPLGDNVPCNRMMVVHSTDCGSVLSMLA